MVFVTGGSGLIGMFLIKELLRQGKSMKALYRNNIPIEFIDNSTIEWIEGDILDVALLQKTIDPGDKVYHCAGLVSYAPQDADLLKEINVGGTANVVDVCLEKGNVKLCHVSSIAAIGWQKGQKDLNETTKWDPALTHSVYASSKYFGELEVWRGIAEGLQAVIVNPSVILGPVTDWNRSSTQLFKYVTEGRSFYTAGSANFVDLRDVVSAMIRLMASDIVGERFILNAGSLSYKNFFTKIALCFNTKAPSIKVPGPLTEVIWRLEAIRSLITGKKPLITKETARIAKKKHIYSNEKIKQMLSFEFRNLDSTIEWCCQELKNLQKLTK